MRLRSAKFACIWNWTSLSTLLHNLERMQLLECAQFIALSFRIKSSKSMFFIAKLIYSPRTCCETISIICIWARYCFLWPARLVPNKIHIYMKIMEKKKTWSVLVRVTIKMFFFPFFCCIILMFTVKSKNYLFIFFLLLLFIKWININVKLHNIF